MKRVTLQIAREIRRLRAEGKGHRTIDRILGLAQDTARRTERRGFAESTSSRWSPEELEALIRLRSEGFYPTRILEHFPGRSLASIKAKLPRLGLPPVTAKPPPTRRSRPAPTPRTNDCYLHLSLIAAANNGKGFPACDLPARFRVAA